MLQCSSSKHHKETDTSIQSQTCSVNVLTLHNISTHIHFYTHTYSMFKHVLTIIIPQKHNSILNKLHHNISTIFCRCATIQEPLIVQTTAPLRKLILIYLLHLVKQQVNVYYQ